MCVSILQAVAEEIFFTQMVVITMDWISQQCDIFLDDDVLWPSQRTYNIAWCFMILDIFIHIRSLY